MAEKLRVNRNLFTLKKIFEIWFCKRFSLEKTMIVNANFSER